MSAAYIPPAETAALVAELAAMVAQDRDLDETKAAARAARNRQTVEEMRKTGVFAADDALVAIPPPPGIIGPDDLLKHLDDVASGKLIVRNSAPAIGPGFEKATNGYG